MVLQKKVVALIVILAGITIGSACQNSSPKTKVLTDANKTFQLTVPGGWQTLKDLNDRADLQVGSRLASLYVIVLQESKEDMSGMTLEKHSDMTREAILEVLSKRKESEPKRLTIDGKPAIQYELRGVLDNIRVVYLHTTVESPTHFYQILAWTLPSKWKKDHATLRKVTEYFHELNPQASSEK